MEGANRESTPTDGRGSTPREIMQTEGEGTTPREIIPTEGRGLIPIHESTGNVSDELIILSKLSDGSSESTPENWQQRYDKYLEDSPISVRGATATSKPSPKGKDKVDHETKSGILL